MTPSDKIMEKIVWKSIPQAANWNVPEESDGYNEGEVYGACVQVYKQALDLYDNYIQYLIDRNILQVIIPKEGNEWEDYLESIKEQNGQQE